MLKTSHAALQAEVHSLRQISCDFNVRHAGNLTEGQALPQMTAVLDMPNADGDIQIDTVQVAFTPGMASSTSTFAQLASKLQSTGMVQKQPSRKTVRPTIGRATGNQRLKSVVTKRSVDIFVSRLLPDAEVEDVVDCVAECLGQLKVLQVDCVKLKSKHEHLYASFHVAVSVEASGMKEAITALMSAESWPEGLLIRRYFKPRNGQQ